MSAGRQHAASRHGKCCGGTAESKNLSMSGNFKRENREIPKVSDEVSDRSANATGGTADMHAEGKSDGSIVPAKAANKGDAESSAESSEERGPAKRNIDQDALHRTPSRVKRRSRGLAGVRDAARKDGKLRFTALMHHVNEDSLAKAFFQLKKTAAVGVDRVTWHEYEQDLQAHIVDLHGRIHRGAYRAKPTRRVWIPKPDGRQRPLGVTSLEDKIVQQACPFGKPV